MVSAAGERASWLVVAGLGLAVVMRPSVGCLPDPGPGITPGQQGLLADVGPEVVLPALERFRGAAEVLSEAVEAWGRAPAGDAEAARVAARQPFLDAFVVWQEIELHQVGPAASSLVAVGGGDLRDEIYSWPTISPCRVDQETVAGTSGSPDFFSSNLVDVYGLDALEHLLFHPDAGNVCPSQVEINAQGTWDALGPEGIDRRRAAYAQAVVGHVLATTDALIEAWSRDGGDFGALLAAPGAGGSPYAGGQEAFNSVFDALFYLELVSRERKLAEPLGLGDCTTACDLLVEGLASGAGVAAIAGNLRGFRALFTGGAGAGFDDLLGQEGHADLAERILVNTDAAIEVADGLSGPLDALVRDDPDAVRVLHDAIEAITDDLEGDVVTVLTLQLPGEAAGDND
ncbi:MAG TPA: hypothetical protein ENK18_26900 [Deltaproteobacteria bacterium]|nr:hypothetical protein [Deltaproteobacteria bacterium]